jgi:hypothetical protein
VTYLPIYLQVVKGESPTSSGLQLMPMMLGMLTTSVVSGRMISEWGRYKPFPIVGTAIMTIGLLLLSQLSIEQSVWRTSLNALVVGFGLGMVMQILVIAVQNSVDFMHLGVATAGTTLFRSIGGALGVAVFGAIFANGLQSEMAGILPAGAALPSASNPEALAALPDALRQAYIAAVVTSLKTVFLMAAAVAAVGFILTTMVHEVPLRGMSPASGSAVSLAMPRDATSLEELERIVAALIARENRWQVYADLAQRAELDLPAPELWLLARLGEHAPVKETALAAELKIPASVLDRPTLDLRNRGIVLLDNDGCLRLTPLGQEMRDRIKTARSKGLADLLSRWEPERHPEVLALLNRMVDSLTRDLPAPGAKAADARA